LELDQRALRVPLVWRERPLLESLAWQARLRRVSGALPLLALRALRELRTWEEVWLGQPRKAVQSARAFPPSVSCHLPAAVVDLAF